MIFYPEPVGSVSPKVNIGDGLIFRKDIGQTLDLLCPAQAFPVPVIRYCIMNLAKFLIHSLEYKTFASAESRLMITLTFIIKFAIFWIVYSEPIGSVAPKVNIGEDLKSVKAEMTKDLTLLCAAQAYPMPVFRFV